MIVILTVNNISNVHLACVNDPEHNADLESDGIIAATVRGGSKGGRQLLAQLS